MKKTLFLLIIILMWFTLSAEKLSVLSELTNPSFMISDGEKIFVLDGYNVFVYSKKDFKLLNKFGKKGEGPGELLTQPDLPLTMILNKDHLIINSFNKMVYFSKKGALIKEIKIPFLVFQILPFGEKYAATQFIRNNDGTGTLNVNFYNKKMKKIKTIYSSRLLNDQGKGKIAYPLLSTHIWCSEKKLFLIDQLKDIQIDIYDINGDKIKTIKKKYEKIKIDKEYIKKKMEWFKIQPAFKSAPDRIRQMIYFLDYLPGIDHFLISDQKIYIQTSKQEKRKTEFIILNSKGKTQKKIMLPNAKIEAIRPTLAANYFFIKNNYYYLIDVEEEWELHKIKF